MSIYILFISAQKRSTHNLCFEQKYENYQNCRGGSNEYSQSMFWAEIWKLSEFLSENFQYLVVKNFNIFE